MSSRKRSSDTAVVSSAQQLLSPSFSEEVAKDSILAGRSNDSTISSVGSGNLGWGRPRLRVRIKRYHGVARWSWNVGRGEEDEVCGICQSAFEGCPPGVKFPGDESPVVFGVCGHAFHLQCVATWLGSSRNTCPICRADWEYGQSGDQQQQRRQAATAAAATATAAATNTATPAAAVGAPAATGGPSGPDSNNNDALSGPADDDSF
jgi:anaphase-promoting complex subunit 11